MTKPMLYGAMLGCSAALLAYAYFPAYRLWVVNSWQNPWVLACGVIGGIVAYYSDELF